MLKWLGRTMRAMAAMASTQARAVRSRATAPAAGWDRRRSAPRPSSRRKAMAASRRSGQDRQRDARDIDQVRLLQPPRAAARLQGVESGVPAPRTQAPVVEEAPVAGRVRLDQVEGRAGAAGRRRPGRPALLGAPGSRMAWLSGSASVAVRKRTSSSTRALEVDGGVVGVAGEAAVAQQVGAGPAQLDHALADADHARHRASSAWARPAPVRPVAPATSATWSDRRRSRPGLRCRPGFGVEKMMTEPAAAPCLRSGSRSTPSCRPAEVEDHHVRPLGLHFRLRSILDTEHHAARREGVGHHLQKKSSKTAQSGCQLLMKNKRYNTNDRHGHTEPGHQYQQQISLDRIDVNFRENSFTKRFHRVGDYIIKILFHLLTGLTLSIGSPPV